MEGRTRAGIVAIVGVSLSVATASAAPPVKNGGSGSAPRIEASEVAAGTAIRLDGTSTRSAFERATPITGFVQRDPKEGAAPTKSCSQAGCNSAGTHRPACIATSD